MTGTLFLVPGSPQPRPGLACVWTVTGNPRQPMICGWINLKTGAASTDNPDTEPESRFRLACA